MLWVTLQNTILTKKHECAHNVGLGQRRFETDGVFTPLVLVPSAIDSVRGSS
jgi:hypothetical protein